MSGHWVHSSNNKMWAYRAGTIDTFIIPDELIDAVGLKEINYLAAINGLPPLPPDAESRLWTM